MSEKREVRSKKFNWAGYILISLIVGQLLPLFDSTVTTCTTNSTGTVVAKKLVAPEGDSPYALVISRGDEAFVFRVNELLWDDVERFDRLYLTDHKGILSGFTRKTTLTANLMQE